MRPFLGCDLRGVDFEIFARIRCVVLAGRGPVANDARADHVGKKFEFLAIPDKHDGAGGTSAVELGDLLVGLIARRDEFHPGSRRWARACAALRLLARSRGQREGRWRPGRGSLKRL